MAIIDVDTFKSKLVGGGARANLFQCIINFPIFVGNTAALTEQTAFMCRSASLPASTTEKIEVPYRGRMIPVAGDRKFEDWKIIVYNDIDFRIRNAFEKWINTINEAQSNTGLSNPLDYEVDMAVHQLDKAGNIVKKYDFRGVFPTSVSAIELNYNQTAEIEQFDVQLALTYFQASDI